MVEAICPAQTFLNRLTHIVGIKWKQTEFSRNQIVMEGQTRKWAVRQGEFPAIPTSSLLRWTYWGRDKMAVISQATLSNAFSRMKMLEFRLKLHWSLFLRVQLTISQHWFRQCLGDKPLSEPMMVRLPTHICVTRPQWVKISYHVEFYMYIRFQ